PRKQRADRPGIASAFNRALRTDRARVRRLMAKVVVGMTLSLDGFVNDRNGSVARLYPDLAALRKTEFLREAIANTGAVVMGRRAYEMASGDFTGYEFQVPIFVVTHRPPKDAPKGQNANLSIAFVTEGTDAAVQRAKKAAGARDVTVVGGASTRRRQRGQASSSTFIVPSP